MPKRKTGSSRSSTSNRRYRKKRVTGNGVKGTQLATRGFKGGYGKNTGELKAVTISSTFQVNTAGSISALCIPATGTDISSRIGRKITLKNLYIKGTFFNEPAGGVTDNTVGMNVGRMIVLIDWQPNGAFPAVTDILTSASPWAHLNLNNRDRFKIIIDKMFTLEPYKVAAGINLYTFGSPQAITFKKYKKLNIDTIFNGTSMADDIATVNSGALLMFWVGNRTSGTADGNFVGETRVRYEDA